MILSFSWFDSIGNVFKLDEVGNYASNMMMLQIEMGF